MFRICALILGGMVLALPAAADRFPVFQPEPLCAGGIALPVSEQNGLGFANDHYIGHYRDAGAVKELQFTVDTPGAWQGDGFPADVCGAKVVLSVDGGPDVRGILEYVPPTPGAEHQPWPFAVTLEGDPLRRMWFAGRYNTSVWGRVEIPNDAGGYDNVFFTGASAHRWE
ncbi:hypothetical protein [uncultured Litoreibacter sp.]|uniref:hypothetical protein n=1 Tax=uncultured Litoreibacter sp. TaxID=1392394 RepID=UPI00260CAE75|nr:hypothetical protein [uncultured Litoreibacter sp.]